MKIKNNLLTNGIFLVISILVFCILGRFIGTLSHASIHSLQVYTGWFTLICILGFGGFSSYLVSFCNKKILYSVILGWCLIGYDYMGYLFNNHDLSGPAALFGKLSPAVSSIMFNIATISSVAIIFILSFEVFRSRKLFKKDENFLPLND